MKVVACGQCRFEPDSEAGVVCGYLGKFRHLAINGLHLSVELRRSSPRPKRQVLDPRRFLPRHAGCEENHEVTRDHVLLLW
jgi:hypothetical protein